MPRSAEVATSGRYSFEPAGRRQLKGFTDPVRVVSVGRAADRPAD